MWVVVFVPMVHQNHAYADLIIPNDSYVASVSIGRTFGPYTTITNNTGASYQYINGFSQLLGDNLAGDPGDQFYFSMTETQISANQYLLEVTFSAFDVNGDPAIWVREGVTNPNGLAYEVWVPQMGAGSVLDGPFDGLRTSRPIVLITPGILERRRRDGSIFASNLANLVNLFEEELYVGAGINMGGADIAGFDFSSLNYSFVVTAAVPEPGSFVLLGLMGVICVIRRR